MASSPQHEPTMEEILASIRKIISEDTPEAAIPAAPVAAPKPVVVEPEAEVLELTQEIREEPKPVAPHVEPAADDADDVVFEPKQEAAMSPARADAPVHSGDGLFSDKTRKAFDDTFSRLGPVDEEPVPPPPARETTAAVAPVDGHTVEAVYDRAIRESFEPVLRDWLDANADAVVDRMKPVIREWLDQHFPAMLEDAVQGEVARVVKARRR
jgi:uncharacterized protein